MPGPILVVRAIRAGVPDVVFRLKPGVMRVGRASTCAIAVAEPSLSREHFEMILDQGACTVRDLGSRNGIRVNGALQREVVLTPGDEIVAGTVVFRLEATLGRLSEPQETDGPSSSDPSLTPSPIFAWVEPSLPAAASAPPAAGTLLAALRDGLSRQPDQRFYALIDGAQAFDLAFAARMMGHSLYTLFTGPLADAAARVGPCLVVAEDTSAFLERWIGQLGSHAGVLFEASGSVENVCRHLRHVFIATDEEQQEYFFRFYDPRVLRAFLPTCRPDELQEFFGPISRWIVEDESGSALNCYRVLGGAIDRAEIRAATR